MITKPYITAKELRDWQFDRWTLYASTMHNGRMLRLWVNGSGKFRLVHDTDFLYEGDDAAQAAKTWNDT